MSEFKGTAHNAAKVGDIAKTVLMPGDPLRAKFIANTFLENVKEFNSVRGMLGFTGTYKGKEVSVMGSGMGMPSIGIYSYELYNFYGVENIIRVGSAGAFVTELALFDMVLTEHAFSRSSYAKCAFGYEENLMDPSEELNNAIKASADKLGKNLVCGTIHSSDNFYISPEIINNQNLPADLLCAEMESFALFANAKYLGKKAACLLTISDSIINKIETTAKERETAFVDMMEIALDAAINL